MALPADYLGYILHPAVEIPGEDLVVASYILEYSEQSVNYGMRQLQFKANYFVIPALITGDATARRVARTDGLDEELAQFQYPWINSVGNREKYRLVFSGFPEDAHRYIAACGLTSNREYIAIDYNEDLGLMAVYILQQ